MANVHVYYDSACPLCPEYLSDIQFWCEVYNHTYEQTELRKEPVKTVEALDEKRKEGYYIQHLPFFVVKNEENESTYTEILSSETIKYILAKY